jgi:hypothetical protein
MKEKIIEYLNIKQNYIKYLNLKKFFFKFQNCDSSLSDDEMFVKLFEKVQSKILDKYKLENLKKDQDLVSNDFKCHEKRKHISKFNEFELKYYAKLLMLYKNKDIYKNFNFKKLLDRTNYTDDDEKFSSKINSIQKILNHFQSNPILLNKIESYLAKMFLLKKKMNVKESSDDKKVKFN